MLKYKVLALVGASIVIISNFSFTTFSVLGNTTVHAEENLVSRDTFDEQSLVNFESNNTETDEVTKKEPSLVKEAEIDFINHTTNTYEEDGNTVIEYLDKDSNVILLEIVNNETQKKTSITRTESAAVVQESEKNSNNEYEVKTIKSPVKYIESEQSSDLSSKENSGMSLQYVGRRKRTYGPWFYTNVAVGRRVVEAIANFGVSSLVASIAALFSIPTGGASFLLSYMGAYVSTGAALGKALDTNNNGWVGLHRRWKYPKPKYGQQGSQYKTK